MQRDGGPGGAGGAGNPVGGSFTGPAETLEIVGDFCYSYSGTISVSNTLTTMNSFQSGNYLAVLDIDLHGTFAQIGQNQFRFQVKMNDATVINTYWEAPLDATIFDFPPRLIVPAYTVVEVNLSQASGVDKAMQTTITGRIYRG